jgi:hypothetical protein
MEPRCVDNLWEEIMDLLEIVFSETEQFPIAVGTIHLSWDLRRDVMFLATKYAHTEGGLISPDNLLPLFLMEERLRQMAARWLNSFENKWINIEKYYFIKQKMVNIEGQINFRIEQFTIRPLSYHPYNLQA